MKNEIETIKKSIWDSASLIGRSLNLMEVCGTHTMAISKYGLRDIMPPNINLISGPGCPVCVTSITDIDRIIMLSRKYPAGIFTFGDMIKVPGSDSSLYLERSRGSDINICYSPKDALDFAIGNPHKEVIFIAIGFETTIPLTAVLIERARMQDIKNFSIINLHKLVPPALKALLEDREIRIDGFLSPGHVSVIIGSHPYEFICKEYGIPCVISGFEPYDIMTSIDMLLRQIKQGKPEVQIQYSSVVRESGNPGALKIIDQVFNPCDSDWRGIGCIPGSGLTLRKKFVNYDSSLRFPIEEINSADPAGCICGEILKGKKNPGQCRLFGKSCRPDHPVGPCMVSSEGSCAAYYRYERFKSHFVKNLP
ncbi:MAG: hydrogenase formation protein HypD [Actinobacteria bacterium]|nr:hydrogenase formation protein HypD [Actinomycetota bacterium]